MAGPLTAGASGGGGSEGEARFLRAAAIAGSRFTVGGLVRARD